MAVPNGFPGAAAPVILSMRSTLPLRLFLSCGLVPTPASPVPTHRNPSGPKRGRQPSWKLLTFIPPTSGSLTRVAELRSPATVQATTRSSLLLLSVHDWHV